MQEGQRFEDLIRDDSFEWSLIKWDLESRLFYAQDFHSTYATAAIWEDYHALIQSSDDLLVRTAARVWAFVRQVEHILKEEVKFWRMSEETANKLVTLSTQLREALLADELVGALTNNEEYGWEDVRAISQDQDEQSWYKHPIFEPLMILVSEIAAQQQRFRPPT